MAVPRFIYSAALLVALAGPADAQSSAQASNIAPDDTRSPIAPRLPLPPAWDATPRQLLADARDALGRGRTGAAQEALERAETRQLDRGDPGTSDERVHARLLQAATEARQALGLRQAARAAAILNAALGMRKAAPQAGATAAARPAPPPTPQNELAYPAQSWGWRWNGVQWVWAGGRYEAASAALWVPAHWAWRGTWVWVPGHWR